MDAKLTKAQLLIMLRQQLTVAREFDKQQRVEHIKHTKDTAVKRRAALRKLLTRSDRDLAELNFYRYVQSSAWPNTADCPLAIAPRYETAITDVTADMRRVFTIGKNKCPYNSLLSWTPTPAKRTVC